VEDMKKVYVPSKKKKVVEKLPIAPTPPPRKISEEEEKAKKSREDRTLRQLRILLRDCLYKLYTEKKFMTFFRPVNGEQFPEYYKEVTNPLDLSIVAQRVDNHEYTNTSSFLTDIDTIVNNATQHNPGNDETRPNRAKAMQDLVNEFLDDADQKVIKDCDEITADRKANGVQDANDSSSSTNTSPRKQAPLTRAKLRSTGEPLKPFDLDKFIMKRRARSPKKDQSPEEKSTQKVVELDHSSDEEANGKEVEENEREQPEPQEEEIVEEVEKELIIDNVKAIKIQDALISKSAGYNIENLVRLRTKMYQILHQHRSEFDKSQLIEELQKFLKSERIL